MKKKDISYKRVLEYERKIEALTKRVAELEEEVEDWKHEARRLYVDCLDYKLTYRTYPPLPPQIVK